MLACRADFRRFLRFADKSAIAALPPDLAVALEEVAVRDAAQQLQITALMLRLDFGNLLERIGDFGETLLFSYFGEVGIEHVPLLVLPFGCRQQVFGRSADPAGRITGRNLQIPAFEEFEETLRMLFFLIRSFRENTCDLLVTLLSWLRLRKTYNESVPGSRRRML